jgi:FkbM family methyltransferase
MPLDGRIGVYMVGGRDGNSPLGLPPILENDVFDVIFEADETAVAQIRERKNPAKSRVFPYCLSDTNGPGTLHLTYDPYMSSLLKIDTEFDLRQWSNGQDYGLTEAGRSVREVPVALRTLDSLQLLDDPELPPPAVIVLDTQGTELAILRGGRELIAEHTMAIVTEAEFLPFYEGQPLFGDVCKALDEWGFVLADFTSGPFRVDPFRAPLGLRSRPMVGFCDALFLRKPKVAAASALHLAQLAFVAQLYGHLDYGFRCFDLLKEIDPDLKSISVERAYRAFLLELDAARQSMPVVFAPTFTDVFPTFDLSNERFDASVPANVQSENRTEQYIKLKARLLAQQTEIQALLSFDDTPVEAVLWRYALETHVQALKDRRIADTTETLKVFGLGVVRETKVVD